MAESREVEVECVSCGDTLSIPADENMWMSFRDMYEFLLRSGWNADNELEEIMCPDCVEEDKLHE